MSALTDRIARQVPNSTLYDRVLYCLRYECIKQGHSDDPEAWAREQLDARSNSELLASISDAMDDMAAEEAAP